MFPYIQKLLWKQILTVFGCVPIQPKGLMEADVMNVVKTRPSLESNIPDSIMQTSIENKVRQKHKPSNGLVLMVTGFDSVRNSSTIKAAVG